MGFGILVQRRDDAWAVAKTVNALAWLWHLDEHGKALAAKAVRVERIGYRAIASGGPQQAPRWSTLPPRPWRIERGNRLLARADELYREVLP